MHDDVSNNTVEAPVQWDFKGWRPSCYALLYSITPPKKSSGRFIISSPPPPLRGMEVVGRGLVATLA